MDSCQQLEEPNLFQPEAPNAHIHEPLKPEGENNSMKAAQIHINNLHIIDIFRLQKDFRGNIFQSYDIHIVQVWATCGTFLN